MITFAQLGPACLKISHTADSIDFRQKYFLCSDLHIDSPHCDKTALARDLDKAKAEGAQILIFGDVFDAMQGRNDRRSSKGSLKPNQLTGAYFDAIVKEVAEFLMPYRENIALIGYGNHETAIITHNETDLLDRLVFLLNLDNPNPIAKGGYGGYVWFHFSRHGSQNASYRLKYFHGSGGSSPVTKGAIGQQRAATMYPDADIVVMGHIHQRQATVFSQETLTQSGKVMRRDQLHLRCPSYLDSYGEGLEGWGVEKGMPPAPVGGWWLEFVRDGAGVGYRYGA